MSHDVLDAGLKKIRFNCGCEFDESYWNKTTEEKWESIPLDCHSAWEMIGQGLTKGVFQLEKSLGKDWCKRLKPNCIRELADVISLIRPGCLNAQYREDPSTGKMLSITETYEKIKNNQLEPEYIHESLEPILKNTYGVLIYQEQIMEICKDFAGFTLEDADVARSAVGKKNEEKMILVEDNFIKSAINQGHEKEMAETIFGWIKEFALYGFNLSHAVGYALLGYYTAYAKSHMPTEFFKNMLTYSESKQDSFDEIKQLIHEAKLFGIEVLPPDVRSGNIDFQFTEDDKLRFGLSHIKNVGESAIPLLSQFKDLETEEELFSLLFSDECKVNKRVVEALIKSGALDFCIENRIRTLGRYKMLLALTDREVNYLKENGLISEGSKVWIRELFDNKVMRPLEKRFARIGDAWKIVRAELGGNFKKLELGFEKFHLGMSISGSETELYFNEKVDCTCRDFLKMRNKTTMTIGALIEEVEIRQDKRNRSMAFMKVSDSTYMLEKVLVFASIYDKCSWLLEEGKVLMITGRKDGTSLLANKIEHI